MSIWHTKPPLDEMNRFSENTIVELLDIKFTAIDPDRLIATMPVDKRTKQPLGLLHGGASVVLSETLASVGAFLTVDPEKFHAVGLEINANHIKSMSEGFVTGFASPYHLGKTTQVWEVKIKDEKDNLVCISRVTMAVLPNRSKEA